MGGYGPTYKRMLKNPHRRHRAPHERGELHVPHTLGERMADRVARGVGSWKFIGVQAAFMALWIATNGFGHDPMPWIMLNLMLSTQAGFTGPVLQLASNRQASINQHRDDQEAEEVSLIYQLLQQNTVLTNEVKALAHALATVNARQLHLLEDALRDAPHPSPSSCD